MCERATGVKGSDVYTSTGSALLDLNVQLVRGAETAAVRAGMAAAIAAGDLADLAVLMFHVRAVRGGKGERALFDTMFCELWRTHRKLAVALAELIPEYGSWADVTRLLMDWRVRPVLYSMMARQLLADAARPEGESISLAAKWAPREGKATGDVAVNLAHQMFPVLGSHAAKMRAYRQLVAGLNRRLATMEVAMSTGRWASIKPEAVPGRAGKLYSRALLNLVGTTRAGEEISRADTECLRHPDDEDRMACRANFLRHFARARRGEAVVHGAETVFPHEVVKRVAEADALSTAERDQMIAMWRGMVEKARVAGGMRRTIFMSDFSGSMRGGFHASHGGGDTPYWVSMALGLLGAEVAEGAFANRLMTFDSTPQWHTFAAGTGIFERVAGIIAAGVGQGLSTDFQAAMDLVLATLKAERVRPGLEPENIVVLTDMGWDQACGSDSASLYTGARYRHHVKTDGWQTHIEMIRESFRRAGEDMWGAGNGWVPPRIVVWNLSAAYGTQNHHATAETPGVIMLSGWSPALFDILQREGPRDITPLEALRMELAHPRYDRVRAVVASATTTAATTALAEGE
jgi:Domain of unknown function (DUF2828)